MVSYSSLAATKSISSLLLGGEKTNQSHFQEFLFHLIEVTVGTDFAHKKILF